MLTVLAIHVQVTIKVHKQSLLPFLVSIDIVSKTCCLIHTLLTRDTTRQHVHFTISVFIK